MEHTSACGKFRNQQRLVDLVVRRLCPRTSPFQEMPLPLSGQYTPSDSRTSRPFLRPTLAPGPPEAATGARLLPDDMIHQPMLATILGGCARCGSDVIANDARWLKMIYARLPKGDKQVRKASNRPR